MQAANPLVNMLPLLLIFVIFYFLLILPQQKKAKEHQKMLSKLKKGDAIITTGGIHGIVTNVRGSLIEVKVSEDVKITFSKEVISYVKTQQDLQQEQTTGGEQK